MADHDRAEPDQRWMAAALAEGAQARLGAPPNPWVGAVVVAGGRVVGAGHSAPAGGDHAEVLALRAAGDAARGAELYVTLEPCSHHGRTPPCVAAVLAAGVRRVVVAVEDPDPRVAGTGIAALRAAGVAVEVGPAGLDAARQLAPYLHHRRTGRAFCVVKGGTSLDGRIAAADGSARWITGAAARADAHRLRAESQAVVVGAGTAITDRPSLTVRDKPVAPAGPPLRVVLDAAGRVPATGPLFDVTLAPTLVVTTGAAPPEAVDAWRAAGAKVEEVPPGPGGVDLGAALELLGRLGVLQALVEGGGRLHGALLAAGLVDRVVAYVAPAVLGAAARPFFDTPGAAAIADAWRGELLDVTRLGDDVRLTVDPRPAPGAAG